MSAMHLRRKLVPLVLAPITLLVLAVPVPPAIATPGSYQLFPTTSTENVTKGPDGNVWYTGYGSHKIGRVTPAGVVTEFALPAGVNWPFGIAAGSDGRIWFTLTPVSASARFARINVDGTGYTEFTTPTPGSGVRSITSGPDGNLWITEQIAGKILQVNPNTGAMKEFNTKTRNYAEPWGITAGPDGALWYTMTSPNKIGRMTTSGRVTGEYLIPTANSLPLGITGGADGAVWFAEKNANKIGRITSTGTITEFPIPTANTGPWMLTAGVDGNVWFTESAQTNVGRITPAGVITEFPVGTTSKGITSGPDDNIWFGAGLNIGRLTPL